MITRANFAQKTQESGILTNQVFKDTYEQLSEYTDGFTRWDDMDDVPELQDVFNDFVTTLEKVLAKKQAAPVQPAAPAASDLHTGKSGFIALYKGKRMDVWADSSLEAQTKAAKAFGAKKRFEVDVHFAESREPQNAAPASDPDRSVNEGKAAIRELLDQGKKKTPVKSKAGKGTQPAKAVPLKKTKAKFKVGQYVRFTRDNRIVRIEEAEYKNLEDITPGWYYRESTIGWIPESEFGLSSKREFDTRVGDENYHDAIKVYATPEEVRHMKRFIANERSSTKDGLTKAYKALQRAITSGKIRKGSQYAPMIMLMQKEYHAALGNGAPYRVKPDDFDLAGLVKAVGGPTVYRSVKAMNYLVGKLGQVLDKKAIDGAIKYITGLRMPLIDPFALQVHEVLDKLKKASSKGETLDISNSNSLDLQGLSGLSALMGLAHQCGCAGHKSLSGLGNLPTVSTAPSNLAMRSGRNSGMKETMTSHELENLSYQTYPFKGKWAELIGSPQTNFSMMVWGSPGAGKSTLMMQFSRYLAENHGNVLYVSSEEFPSYTLKTKLNLVGGAAHGWEFSKNLNSLRADHKFLVLDSTNHYRFTTADLKALMVRRPDLSILLVVQITKGGNFKGDQSLEHEVDTVVKVAQEGATTIKNRFQPLSSAPVFDDAYSLSTTKSNLPHVNSNRKTLC